MLVKNSCDRECRMGVSDIMISVIIPIYNCQQYLVQCMDSVRNQTIKKLEIICVDDGSTDESASIIQQYAREDNRIVLFRQENQGPGAARNRGIREAKGKYVAFLDADDFYLDKEALEKMYLLSEKKSVAICGSFRRHLEPYGFKDTHIIDNDREYARQEVILDYIDYQFDYEYQNFIFLRKLLIDNSVWFPNYRRYEDPPFFVRALYFAEKFVIADTYLYCYRVPNQMQRGGVRKTTELLSGIIDNLRFAAEHRLDILFHNTVKHIDYERRYLITSDLQENNISILEKLIEATKIIREYSNDPEYIVNPLRDVIKGFLDKQKNYENDLRGILEQNEKIIVYGAGNLAQIFLNYLSEKDMKQKVQYVMVSREVAENEMFLGVPMVSIRNREKCSEIKEKYVFVVTTGAYHEEIMASLGDNGFRRFEAVNDAFLLDYANRKSEE